MIKSDETVDIKIMVSVYCLAYNHEKYIRHTLNGFVSQKTNFRYEVFVHDDASTDNTASIIQEYADKYPDIIKPIFQTENQHSQKIPIIATHILPKMSGKYIAACEGDDFWNDENKLQKQYDALEAHPECSISTHKVQCCNEDGTPNSRIIPEDYYKIHGTQKMDRKKFAECLWVNGDYPFHTSSYFFRAKVMKEKVALVRDTAILMKSFINGTVYYFDEAMSTRRLFSIGGFNDKLKKKGVSGSIELSKSNINNCRVFNEYTNNKYHKYTDYRIYTYIMSWAKYEPDEAKKYLSEYNLSFSKVSDIMPSTKLKIKQGLKYFLLKVFPFILKIFR